MSQTSWKPSASLENLRVRAQILKTIRDFFSDRDVLEVETPLLCRTSVTDPFIQSIPAIFQAHPNKKEERYYLQTSPEYAMKRLLAAGSGPIYQITKAFRQGELGRYHNPEFTLLEWYQLGYDHHALMDEMDELLQLVLKKPSAERISYADLFLSFFNIDPHQAALDELQKLAEEKNISIAAPVTDCDTWLNLLMTHSIEPQLGQEKPVFIFDFPASQAALAKIQPSHPPLGSRFEVYYRGIELANGFHELACAQEQRSRFERNIQQRRELGLPEMMLDEFFLASLTDSFPDCSGVALGIDRLVMLATESNQIDQVLSFDFKCV